MSDEKLYDEALSLLSDCLFTNKRTRAKAEQAVAAIAKLSDGLRWNIHSFKHLIRGMIEYPDLLRELLNNGVELWGADIAAMLARCCEVKRKKRTDAMEHHPSSKVVGFNLLVDYINRCKQKPEIDLKLMWSIYHLDDYLVAKLRDIEIVDPTYEAFLHNEELLIYPYCTDKDAVEGQNNYYGYRDIVHLCQIRCGYKAAIANSRNAVDCRIDAICTYLGVPYPKDFSKDLEDMLSTVHYAQKK